MLLYKCVYCNTGEPKSYRLISVKPRIHKIIQYNSKILLLVVRAFTNETQGILYNQDISPFLVKSEKIKIPIMSSKFSCVHKKLLCIYFIFVQSYLFIYL